MDSNGRGGKKYYQSGGYRGRGGGGGKSGKYRGDDDNNSKDDNNNMKNGSNSNNNKDTSAADDKLLSIPAPKTKGGRGGGGGPGGNKHQHQNDSSNNKYGSQKKTSSKQASRTTTPPPQQQDTSSTAGLSKRAAARAAKGGKYAEKLSDKHDSKHDHSSHHHAGKDSASSKKHASHHGEKGSETPVKGHGGAYHKDPNTSAVEEATKNAFAFPSNPPTIDDISSPPTHQGPSIGRQNGQTGPSAPPVVTHASRILDPGGVFPRTPFIAVGDITSGPILRTHINMMSNAVNGSFDKTTTASPKFAHYSALTLMEQEPRNCTLLPAYQTQVYRSSNRFSGSLVCIRRIVSCPSITAERCSAVSEQLRQFRHPNLAQLNSVIATTEFSLGSNDVLLEYKYIKGARSLQDIVNAREELTESSIWSIACQLLSLVRHFHESEVPLRGLHLSKLLLVQDPGSGTPCNNGGSQRIIFTGLGLVDVLGTTDVPPPPSSIPQLLRNDIVAVGTILSQLVHGSLNVDKNVNVQSSPMFTPALFALVRACRDGTSVIQLCRALGERMSMELGNALSNSDYILGEFQKEVHNGRLMKLLMRLNFAYCANQHFQDYDTLFIVRLFYQYLFAQADEHGNSQFDWGLVYHGLNKLDIGSEDLVQLVSEQDHTLFVVSYKDVARCIDSLCDGMLTGGRQQQQANQQQQVGGGATNAQGGMMVANNNTQGNNNTNNSSLQGGGISNTYSQQQNNASHTNNHLMNQAAMMTGGGGNTNTGGYGGNANSNNNNNAAGGQNPNHSNSAFSNYSNNQNQLHQQQQQQPGGAPPPPPPRSSVGGNQQPQQQDHQQQQQHHHQYGGNQQQQTTTFGNNTNNGNNNPYSPQQASNNNNTGSNNNNNMFGGNTNNGHQQQQSYGMMGGRGY